MFLADYRKQMFLADYRKHHHWQDLQHTHIPKESCTCLHFNVVECLLLYELRHQGETINSGFSNQFSAKVMAMVTATVTAMAIYAELADALRVYLPCISHKSGHSAVFGHLSSEL